MAKFGFKLDVGKEAKSVAKDDSSAMQKGLKGVMEGLGIGTGIELIAGVFKSFQPLITVLSSIMKMLRIS